MIDSYYSDEIVGGYCPICRHMNMQKVLKRARNTMGFVCSECGAKYTVSLQALRKGRKVMEVHGND